MTTTLPGERSGAGHGGVHRRDASQTGVTTVDDLTRAQVPPRAHQAVQLDARTRSKTSATRPSARGTTERSGTRWSWRTAISTCCSAADHVEAEPPAAPVPGAGERRGTLTATARPAASRPDHTTADEPMPTTLSTTWPGTSGGSGSCSRSPSPGPRVPAIQAPAIPASVGLPSWLTSPWKQRAQGARARRPQARGPHRTAYGLGGRDAAAVGGEGSGGLAGGHDVDDPTVTRADPRGVEHGEDVHGVAGSTGMADCGSADPSAAATAR